MVVSCVVLGSISLCTLITTAVIKILFHLPFVSGWREKLNNYISNSDYTN
jgi:hypothetical protein